MGEQAVLMGWRAEENLKWMHQPAAGQLYYFMSKRHAGAGAWLHTNL